MSPQGSRLSVTRIAVSRLSVSRKDILWTLLPALLWAALSGGVRPLVSHLECSQSPELCAKESIPWPDRLGVDFANAKADDWSYSTQNWAGIVALGFPAVVGAAAWTLKHTSFHGFVIGTGVDLVVLLQATFLNGALMETVRLVVQRPRPSVYRSPTVEGSRAENYTSFYSGHTSFTAVAAAVLLGALLARGANLWICVLGGSIGLALMFLTAIFRVLGGRHFMTDVMAGAMAGLMIGYWVVLRHWRSDHDLPHSSRKSSQV